MARSTDHNSYKSVPKSHHRQLDKSAIHEQVSIFHLHRICLADAYTTVPQAFCTSLWPKYEAFFNYPKNAKIAWEYVQVVYWMFEHQSLPGIQMVLNSLKASSCCMTMLIPMWTTVLWTMSCTLCEVFIQHTALT
jgi:hypothetical protein